MSFWRDNVWSLPESPDDAVFREVIDDINATTDEREARGKFRLVCEADFWFYLRYASTFGNFVISDRSHPRYGTLWAEHPWIFDRCRDIQKSWEARESGIFWNWPRYHFKTTLLTGHHTCWALMRDPSETFLLLTYKVDETGESMYDTVRDELEKNLKLRAHWPDVLTDAAIKGFTKKSLTIGRPLGPKEPSVSVHSLDKLPTSFHGSTIKIDDAVVRETVRSQLMIDSTLGAMRALTFLGADDTVKWWIGTIWDQYDPYMRSLSDGRFARRDWWTPYFRVDGEQNEPPKKPESVEPILRSERMLGEWEKDCADPYVWSCQMWGWPVAREEQVFDPSWLARYRNTPKEEAEGKEVHFFVDTAGEGKSGDRKVIYVQGLGYDRLRYSLDLHRETWQLVDLIDNLFVLVRYWRPKMVWIEQVWDKGTLVAIKQDMEHRRFRFNIKALPDTKKPKTERIKLLQVAQRNAQIIWPQDGFGHGSKSLRDPRDTLKQFIDDEYRMWTPTPNSVMYDDMLDAVAWSIQPEVNVRFPEDHVAYDGENALFPAASDPLEGVSPWVML